MFGKNDTITGGLLKHFEMHGEFTDREIQLKILYTQEQQLKRLKKIDSSTSVLAWFLVIIPILIIVIYVLFNFGKLGM